MLRLLRVFLIAAIGVTFFSGCCLLKYWPMPWGRIEVQEPTETVPVLKTLKTKKTMEQKIAF